MKTSGIYITPLEIKPNKYRTKSKSEHLFAVISNTQIIIVKAKNKRQVLETLQLENIQVENIKDIQELNLSQSILLNYNLSDDHD